MKLTLNLNEILAGETTRRISEKQTESLASARTRQHSVVAIRPITCGTKTYTLVRIHECITGADKQTCIMFTPIACRAFQVLDARTREILRLTVDFDGAQYTFMQGSPHGVPSTYRTSGPGVDPEMKPIPETLLAKMIAMEPIPEVAVKALRYITTNYQRQAVAA